jgi:hypothetical protein
MTYSEETMDFEHLAVFLLPLEVGLAGLFEVEIREVSEERVTLLWAGDI